MFTPEYEDAFHLIKRRYNPIFPSVAERNVLDIQENLCAPRAEQVGGTIDPLAILSCV
jgi:hypothetical protein